MQDDLQQQPPQHQGTPSGSAANQAAQALAHQMEMDRIAMEESHEKGGGLWSRHYNPKDGHDLLGRQIVRGIVRVFGFLGDRLHQKWRIIPDHQRQSWDAAVTNIARELFMEGERDVVENALLIWFPLTIRQQPCYAGLHAVLLQAAEAYRRNNPLTNADQDTLQRLGLQPQQQAQPHQAQPSEQAQQQQAQPQQHQPQQQQAIPQQQQQQVQAVLHVQQMVQAAKLEIRNTLLGVQHPGTPMDSPCITLDMQTHHQLPSYQPAGFQFVPHLRGSYKYKLVRGLLFKNKPGYLYFLVGRDQSLLQQSNRIYMGAHQFILWAMHGYPEGGQITYHPLLEPRPKLAARKLASGSRLTYKALSMHVCSNPSCLNPLHLFYGEKSNNQRAVKDPYTSHTDIVCNSAIHAENSMGLMRRSPKDHFGKSPMQASELIS